MIFKIYLICLIVQQIVFYIIPKDKMKLFNTRYMSNVEKPLLARVMNCLKKKKKKNS